MLKLGINDINNYYRKDDIKFTFYDSVQVLAQSTESGHYLNGRSFTIKVVDMIDNSIKAGERTGLVEEPEVEEEEEVVEEEEAP